MNRCPHLAGHCVETGVHHDHLGRFHVLPGACGVEHAIRVRLEHWDGAVPAVAVYAGDGAFDLTARQAMQLAGVLAWWAVWLVVARRVQGDCGPHRGPVGP